MFGKINLLKKYQNCNFLTRPNGGKYEQSNPPVGGNKRTEGQSNRGTIEVRISRKETLAFSLAFNFEVRTIEVRTESEYKYQH